MKIVVIIARILLGLAFFVFGLNGFFHFMPNPPPTPAAGAFFGALINNPLHVLPGSSAPRSLAERCCCWV